MYLTSIISSAENKLSVSFLPALGHHVVVHDRLGAEEREAARAAEDAAEDVLGGLLQPVAHRVLELLVPDIVDIVGTYDRRYPENP